MEKLQNYQLKHLAFLNAKANWKTWASIAKVPIFLTIIMGLISWFSNPGSSVSLLSVPFTLVLELFTVGVSFVYRKYRYDKKLPDTVDRNINLVMTNTGLGIEILVTGSVFILALIMGFCIGFAVLMPTTPMIIIMCLVVIATIIGMVMIILAWDQALYIYGDDLTNKRTIQPITEYLRASNKLMKGHKMELLWLQLSLIGWKCLNTITAGFASIFTMPYLSMVYMNFYDNLKGNLSVSDYNEYIGAAQPDDKATETAPTDVENPQTSTEKTENDSEK